MRVGQWYQHRKNERQGEAARQRSRGTFVAVQCKVYRTRGVSAVKMSGSSAW
jgi:hypothetical protein